MEAHPRQKNGAWTLPRQKIWFFGPTYIGVGPITRYQVLVPYYEVAVII